MSLPNVFWDQMNNTKKHVPLLLPRRMECPRRALGKGEVLALLTASGRSDQSHRLAPVSITPYTLPPKTKK